MGDPPRAPRGDVTWQEGKVQYALGERRSIVERAEVEEKWVRLWPLDSLPGTREVLGSATALLKTNT